MPARDADRIRNYATKLVDDARRDGERFITIRSGDVHDALSLSQAHSNVGQSLEGDKFQKQAGVKFVDYHGVRSHRGANSNFVFEILPISKSEPKEDLSVSWREKVIELSPSEFQELAREYLQSKGFDNAEIEIVIRMKM